MYNVQSVINKPDNLNSELVDFDVISLTETWLYFTIPTDDLLPHSYSKPKRKDRERGNHGGVMIYIKEGVYYKRKHDLEIRDIECIWIELVNNHKRILFSLSYRPPNSDLNYYNNIENSIALAVDTDIRNIIIIGEFNFNT